MTRRLTRKAVLELTYFQEAQQLLDRDGAKEEALWKLDGLQRVATVAPEGAAYSHLRHRHRVEDKLRARQDFSADWLYDTHRVKQDPKLAPLGDSRDQDVFC